MSTDFLNGVKEKYPEQILDGRVNIEGCVIACIWKDPLLLSETKLDKSNFITRDGRRFYNLAQVLADKGLKSFDSTAVYSTLDDDQVKVLEDIGGFQSIDNMINSTDTANFQTYIDRLSRECYICYLWDNNVDITKEIKFKDVKVTPLEIMREMGSASEAMDFYESILMDPPIEISTIVKEDELVELDDEWLMGLVEGEENGYPFAESFTNIKGKPMICYPKLSDQVQGLLPGATTMLGAYSSVGKSTWWIGVIMALVAGDHKVLVISNEEKSTKFKQKCLVWLINAYLDNWHIRKKKLLEGSIDDKQMAEIRKVQKFFREKISSKIRYVSLPDANISEAKKIIRSAALTDGFDTVIYDTFKIQATDMKDARQDLALVRDSRELDILAKKYQLIMCCSVQLAEHAKGKLWLDSSTLSNSKQIKEQLENLFLLRNVYDDELNQNSKYYIRPFAWKLEDGRWVEKEETLDKSKCYKVLFIEKSRNGANSADSGTAILLQFDGDFARFREVCLCRPRYGSIT